VLCDHENLANLHSDSLELACAMSHKLHSALIYGCVSAVTLF